MAALALAAVAAAPVRGGEQGDGVRVRAALTYRTSEGTYVRARLRIVRNGRTLVDRRLSELERPGVRVVRVTVRDLDADREPEVLLEVYTGGAHCCTDAVVYRYLPRRRAYAGSRHPFGNAGFRLADLDRDGRPELEGGDDRFAYLFTSYAASAFPLRIVHFDHGRTVDVTRRFPALVRAQAHRLWRAYLESRNRPSGDPRGVLAAWLADMHLLGREEEGWRRLEQAYRRGDLGPRPALAGWPQGRAYLRALRSFLVRTGYARSPG